MSKFFYVFIFTLLVIVFPTELTAVSGVGELVKTPDFTAVYVVREGKRYLFPDAKVYESWYGNDFSMVQEISLSELQSYQLAGNVTYKIGSLIKIQTYSQVYEVTDSNGEMKWLINEETAIKRHGNNWASLVRDVSAGFFINYQLVGSIEEASSTLNSIWDSYKVSGVVDAYMNMEPSIAWNGSGYGIVWRGRKNNTTQRENEIYFVRIDSGGNKIGSEIKLTDHNLGPSIAAVGAPEITWNGEEFGMIWMDGPTLDAEGNAVIGNRLKFIRLDINGNKLSEELSIGPTSVFTEELALIWTGDNWSLAYNESALYQGEYKKEVYFAKIKSDGSDFSLLSDGEKASEIRVTEDEFYNLHPILAWDGNNYGLVWEDGSYFSSLELSASAKAATSFLYINSEGQSLIDKVKLANFAESDLAYMYDQHIFWNGNHFDIFASLGVPPAGDESLKGIYFTKVSSAGDKIINLSKIITSDNEIRELTVVKGDSSYGVLWINNTGLSLGNLYFSEVDFNGNILTASQGVSDTGTIENPELVWDGSKFNVVWDNGDGLYFAKQN